MLFRYFEVISGKNLIIMQEQETKNEINPITYGILRFRQLRGGGGGGGGVGGSLTQTQKTRIYFTD